MTKNSCKGFCSRFQECPKVPFWDLYSLFCLLMICLNVIYTLHQCMLMIPKFEELLIIIQVVSPYKYILMMFFFWSCSWGLRFNPLKCKVITLFRRAFYFEYVYTLNNVKLQKVSSVVDLGVDCIGNSVKKGSQCLGRVKRTQSYDINSDKKKSSFTSFGCPILEYCSVVSH